MQYRSTALVLELISMPILSARPSASLDTYSNNLMYPNKLMPVGYLGFVCNMRGKARSTKDLGKANSIDRRRQAGPSFSVRSSKERGAYRMDATGMSELEGVGCVGLNRYTYGHYTLSSPPSLLYPPPLLPLSLSEFFRLSKHHPFISRSCMYKSDLRCSSTEASR